MRIDVQTGADHFPDQGVYRVEHEIDAEYSIDEVDTEIESSSSDEDNVEDPVTMIECVNSVESLAILLERRGSIRSSSVAGAFRKIDRAQFVPEQCIDCAYDDSPLRALDTKSDGCIVHLSAPSIYAAVLEALDLKPRDAFLNIGSGSGYLSTLAATILGPDSVHHCLERCPSLARRCQETFANDPNMRHVIVHQGGVSLFELDVDNSTLRFDKIYCAAGAKSSDKQLLARFLKPNGVLVGPFETDNIIRVAIFQAQQEYDLDQNQEAAAQDHDHEQNNVDESDSEDEEEEEEQLHIWPGWRRRIHRPQCLIRAQLKDDTLEIQELMPVQFTPLVRERCSNHVILKGPTWGEASSDLFPPAFRLVVALIARANSKQSPHLPWHVWQAGILAYLSHDDVKADEDS